MASQAISRERIEQLVREALRARRLAEGNGCCDAGTGPAPAPSRPDADIRPPAPALPSIPADAPRGLVLPPRLAVNISARHVHVRQDHLEQLFGPGTKLTKLKDLYQEGEFASEQVVSVIGPRQRVINSVRILGPVRSYTQVELSFTDGISLGIDLPIRISGNHDGTPGCWLMGPAGMLELDRGVIRAARHIHLHPAEAAYFGVKDGDPMELIIDSPQPVILRNVIVRVHPRVKCEVHLDTDEGNACYLDKATKLEIRRQA